MVSFYVFPGITIDLPKLYYNSDAMRIAREVADMYDISVSTMLEQSRKPLTVEPRQMAMVRIYRELKLGQQETVELFGLIEHSTLIHAAKTIDDRMEMGQLLFNVDIKEYSVDKLMVNGKVVPKDTTEKKISSILNGYERKAYYDYIQK